LYASYAINAAFDSSVSLMRRYIVIAIGLSLSVLACAKSHAERTAEPLSAGLPLAGEPDYSTWNRLLRTYYDPARGMDYAHLKSGDAAALEQLRHYLSRANIGSLTSKQQLAYWINLYNVSVVSTVVEHYPVKSIRDISTDPIIGLNVFEKETVPFGSGQISLNTIENEKIRNGFHDPRIHFAINCAARSCPPIRPEAYVGERVDAQLDDQVRKFVAGPAVRIETRDGKMIMHTTKIMDWFGEDFEKWGGGKVPFLRRYLPPKRAHLLPQSGNVTIKFDHYDWSLDDWRR
jgi:hypothetical protein